MDKQLVRREKQRVEGKVFLTAEEQDQLDFHAEL